MSLLLSQLSPVVPPGVAAEGWWTPTTADNQTRLSRDAGWWLPVTDNNQVQGSRSAGWEEN